MGKRGISPVVAVVLIVLVVIVLVLLIASLTIPQVRELLSGRGDCFKVVADISIETNSEYTCKYSTGENPSTVFALRIDNENIKGFRAGLLAEGSSKSYDIEDGTSSEKIRMLEGTYNQPLVVDNKGGVKVYVAEGIIERIDISPILTNGKVCDDYSKDVSPQECISINVKKQLNEPPSGGYCGDGIIQSERGEECDDGNTISGDGCSADCKWEGGTFGECTLAEAYWETTSGLTEAYVGESVKLVVKGNSDCDGETVTFNPKGIKEYDSGFALGGNDVTILPNDVKFNGEEATASWNAEWLNDDWTFGGESNPPEYYFIATLSTGLNVGDKRESPKGSNEPDMLEVYKCGDGLYNPGREECDDGNTNSGDGCSSTCQIESGWVCTTPLQKSQCNYISPGSYSKCVDDQCKEEPCNSSGCQNECSSNKECEIKNKCNDNGVCDPGEEGICCNECPASGPPYCINYGKCGDGYVNPGEQCDDACLKGDPEICEPGVDDGDGCSASCQEESGWICKHPTGKNSKCCDTQTQSCSNVGVSVDPPSGGNPYTNWWEPWSNTQVGSCNEPSPAATLSCIATFSTLGFQSSSGACSSGTSAGCAGFDDCNMVPSYCQPGGTFPGISVCCLQNGGFAVSFIQCQCPQEFYNACVDNQCVSVLGTGPDECQTNQECDNNDPQTGEA